MGSKWFKFFFILGVILLILGAIDPLEGSAVILLGSLTLAVTSHFLLDRHKQYFAFASICIAFGVISMFILTALGGFGGKSQISWWWGLFILPYPLGWLGSIALLLFRGFKKKDLKELTEDPTD